MTKQPAIRDLTRSQFIGIWVGLTLLTILMWIGIFHMASRLAGIVKMIFSQG